MKQRRFSLAMSGTSGLLMASGLGVLASLLLLTLLLLGAAAFLLGQEDPMQMLFPSALLSLALASLVGGLLAATLLPEKRILASLLCGAVLLLLLFALSIVLPGEDGVQATPVFRILAYVIPVLASGLGALVFHKRKKRPANRRRRR